MTIPNKPVKYYRFSNAVNKKSKKDIEDIDPKKNILFNISQGFVDELQSMTSVEIGQAQPYISLASVDEHGNTIDYNIEYFHKGIDFQKVGQSRYSDRPVMSLDKVDINTEQSSGYMYFSRVIIYLKIHNPELLNGTRLISLMFPGQSLKLRYGWNHTADGSTMNKKQTLYLNVHTYQLSYDMTGQVDLTVETFSINNRLTTVYVGDDGGKVKELDALLEQASSVAAAKDVRQPSEGILSEYEKMQEYSKYLANIKESIDSKKNPSDYRIVKRLADRSIVLQETRRKSIVVNLNKKFEQLSKAEFKTEKETHRAPINKKPSKTEPRKKYPHIKFHDLVRIICGDTLQASAGLMWGIDELRIIYGNLNNAALLRAGESIADFEISKEDINQIYNQKRKNNTVFTVSGFINSLVSFFDDDRYWTAINITDTLDKPTIVIHYEIVEEGSKKYLNMHIIDAKCDLPNTTSAMKNRADPEEDIIKRLRNHNPDMPIIKLGHAQSFIRSINLSQISDPHMKAVFINRMDKAIREAKSRVDIDSAQTPLSLPLEGTAELLGSVNWRPMVWFYLSTGIFLASGIYRIMGVSHSLSKEGFVTTIDFKYN